MKTTKTTKTARIVFRTEITLEVPDSATKDEVLHVAQNNSDMTFKNGNGYTRTGIELLEIDLDEDHFENQEQEE